MADILWHILQQLSQELSGLEGLEGLPKLLHYILCLKIFAQTLFNSLPVDWDKHCI